MGNLGSIGYFNHMVFMNLTTDRLRDEKSGLKWEISDLQGKIEKLRKEVQSEEKMLAEVRTWGIELVKNKGQRWIMLSKKDQPGKKVSWDNGRSGIEVVPKK